MAASRAVNPNSPTVDVLFGGFLASARGFEDLRRAMEETSGNPTVFIEPTRWGRFIFWPNNAYPRVFFRQALHTAQALRARGIRRVRLYGLSMGAPVVMIIADAFRKSLDVEQVVLINPACVYVDGFRPLGRRAITKIRADLHDFKHHPDHDVRRILQLSRSGALYYLSNLPRSIAEGVAISRSPLFARLLPRLDARNIPVFACYAELDMLFAAESMVAALACLPDGHVFLLEGIPHDAQFYPGMTAAVLKRHGAL